MNNLKQQICSSSTSYEFFLELKNNNEKAIVKLKNGIAPLIKNLTTNRHISYEDYEEILNDTILICLRKIQNGSYQFMSFSPISYAIEIARRLIANFCRKRTLPIVHLDYYQFPQNTTPLDCLLQKENVHQLKRILSKLGKTGEQLIRLHYLDGYRDKEVISLGLTTYRTINSLKTKRNVYMKKLSTLLETE